MSFFDGKNTSSTSETRAGLAASHALTWVLDHGRASHAYVLEVNIGNIFQLLRGGFAVFFEEYNKKCFFTSEKRSEMTPQSFQSWAADHGTPQFGLLEWLSAQASRKAARTLKDSRPGRNLECAKLSREVSGILALCDSLLDSKTAVTCVLRRLAFPRCDSRARGARNASGSQHSAGQSCSQWKTLSAICAFSKRPSRTPFPLLRICQQARVL